MPPRPIYDRTHRDLHDETPFLCEDIDATQPFPFCWHNWPTVDHYSPWIDYTTSLAPRPTVQSPASNDKRQSMVGHWKNVLVSMERVGWDSCQISIYWYQCDHRPGRRHLMAQVDRIDRICRPLQIRWRMLAGQDWEALPRQRLENIKRVQDARVSFKQEARFHM